MLPNVTTCLLSSCCAAEHDNLAAASRGVFVVVLSLKDPPAERREKADFWTQFIASALPTNAAEAPLPRVVFVLSHRDRPAKGRRDAAQLINGEWFSAWGDELVEEYRAKFKGRLSFQAEPFVVDCRDGNSNSMKQLRGALCSIHTELQQTAQPVTRVMDDVLDKLPTLRQEHLGWPIVSNTVLQGGLEECTQNCPPNLSLKRA
eukprot:m.216142 g.216142  ORF g.216142 m.216142 type:complete len:204 (-) comp18651_c0_seq1:1769-2380(-)